MERACQEQARDERVRSRRGVAGAEGERGRGRPRSVGDLGEPLERRDHRPEKRVDRGGDPMTPAQLDHRAGEDLDLGLPARLHVLEHGGLPVRRQGREDREDAVHVLGAERDPLARGERHDLERRRAREVPELRDRAERAIGGPQDRRDLVHAHVEHELPPLLAEDVGRDDGGDAGAVEERLHSDDPRVGRVVGGGAEDEAADVRVAGVGPLPDDVVAHHEGVQDLLGPERGRDGRLARDAVQERQDDRLVADP